MALIRATSGSGGSGTIGPVPFTPNSAISSNTIVAIQGLVSITGEIVLNTSITAGYILLSGLPAPSSAIDIVDGVKLKNTTSTRKLTIDTSGNLKLASGESYMGEATWVLSVSYPPS